MMCGFTDMEAMCCHIVTRRTDDDCMEDTEFMDFICFRYLSLIAR